MCTTFSGPTSKHDESWNNLAGGQRQKDCLVLRFLGPNPASKTHATGGSPAASRAPQCAWVGRPNVSFRHRLKIALKIP
jgi:hypothetical protein